MGPDAPVLKLALRTGAGVGGPSGGRLLIRQQVRLKVRYSYRRLAARLGPSLWLCFTEGGVKIKREKNSSFSPSSPSCPLVKNPLFLIYLLPPSKLCQLSNQTAPFCVAGSRRRSQTGRSLQRRRRSSIWSWSTPRSAWWTST